MGQIKEINMSKKIHKEKECDLVDKEYIFYEFTNSLCSTCKKTVPAKIVIKGERVYILKYCCEHGEHIELLEEQFEYHKKKRLYDKPGTKMKVHTFVDKGCPYDCGICPQHDQHACIGLIEVTNKCNLKCPLCFANAGEGEFLPIEKINKMLDFFLDSEYGNGEILQISGGEPTLHPNIIEIIKMARNKGFKYVMLNTNGIRLAADEGFVRELSEFTGGFEIYLQFDGFNETTYQILRGKNILDVKKKAIKNLSKYKIPITLVAAISADVNDDEVGQIFEFGLNTPYVRGINFQPQAFFGRSLDIEKRQNRVTLSGIIKRLEKQTGGILKFDDFIPLPCNSEGASITYLYRSSKGEFIPITRDSKIHEYTNLINNTFVFTIEDTLKNAGKSLDSLRGACDCFKFLKDFKHIVPFDFFMKSKEKKKDYIDENTFRISISSFIDNYNFTTRAMQKECVHVVTEDMRKIPFSAYNTIYRGE